jgi:hypothetical protein
MTPTEYVELQAQITRQMPEQAQYQVDADDLTAAAVALQPSIDAAQADVDAAQEALDYAIEHGEDPVPYEEALAAAQAVLDPLLSQQAALEANAQVAQQNADALTAAIAMCQAEIDAGGPPPSPGQQAAANAAIIAAAPLAYKIAKAGAVHKTPTLFVDLPPAVGMAGLRAMVSDATVGPSTKFMDALAGGGTKTVPVYSDGLVWRIG